MVLTKRKAAHKKKHTPNEVRLEVVPSTTQNQQSEIEGKEAQRMAYIAVNLIDLEDGFKAGVMIKATRNRENKQDIYADTFLTLGSTLTGIEQDNKLTPERSIDVLMQDTYAQKYGVRKQGSKQLRKMITLFKLLSEGKEPRGKQGYFHFRGKNAAEKARRTAELFTSYGFETKYISGKNGFSITGLPKDLKSGYANLRDGFLGSVREKYLALQESRKEKKFDFEELIASGDKFKPKPDKEFEKMFSDEELANLDPVSAAKEIASTFASSSVSGIQTYNVTFFLTKRRDVKNILKELRQLKPFKDYSPAEFKEVVNFIAGLRSQRTVSTKTNGNELAWLRNFHARRSGRVRTAKKREDSLLVAARDKAAIQKIEEGKKAILLRSTYVSAAETIAALENRYPGRSLNWERTPEARLSGGGSWTITVEAKGKKAITNMQWFRNNFGNQINQGAATKDARFNRAVGRAMNGGVATVSFTNKNVPRWMSALVDRKKTTPETIYLKEEVRNKLSAKGIVVQAAIRGTPVYASRADKKRGKVKYYKYELIFSGKKFGDQLRIARSKSRRPVEPKLKEVTFEGSVISRGDRRLIQERVKVKLEALKKQAEDKQLARKKKSSKKKRT